MSQVSDVSIANQGFSAFRTELNNILGAINSSHIGSSAPASLAQGSLWIDTSGGATAWILKLYDGAGHISLGTINSTANTVDWTDSSVSIDITGTAAETSANDADEILIYDASATANKKMTRANFLSGVGGTNKPAFFAQKTDSVQAFSTGTATKLTFNNEVLDSDTKYASDRFTPTEAGYYSTTASWGINTSSDVTQMKCMIYKNGSVYAVNHEYSTELSSCMVTCIVYLDADDYIEVYGEHNRGSDASAKHDNNTTYFGAFKLIT